jgi:hypothetical protein
VTGVGVPAIDARSCCTDKPGRKSSRTPSQPSLAWIVSELRLGRPVWTIAARELRLGRRVRVRRARLSASDHQVSRRLSRRSGASVRDRREGGLFRFEPPDRSAETASLVSISAVLLDFPPAPALPLLQ